MNNTVFQGLFFQKINFCNTNNIYINNCYFSSCYSNLNGGSIYLFGDFSNFEIKNWGRPKDNGEIEY